MSLQLKYTSHILKFKFDAGTSRGVLREKKVWYIKLFDIESPSIYGIGEVATLERLSIDCNVTFEEELLKLAKKLTRFSMPEQLKDVFYLVHSLISPELPALRFALEIALLDLRNGGKRMIFDNGFYQKEQKIPINGLVWMGDEIFMKAQIDSKISEGFSCIKMKIGAIDFDAECKLLRHVRKKYSKNKLILRVDANGAFRTEDCMLRLKALEEFDLHSIEQPIMPKQPESMGLLCVKSKIPIALDEELIGIHDKVEKAILLEDTKPKYIILKPGLIGGFHSAMEWIEIAEKMGISWWITSALESNIGLNAICQFTTQYKIDMHQGLGTGQLFENNVLSPLTVEGGYICYNQSKHWDLTDMEFSGKCGV